MPPSPYLLTGQPRISAKLQAQIASDYERFAESMLPDTLEAYLLDRYGLDISAEYAGFPLKNPWGKASGQLSMTARQVEDDVDAGLGFVVLKTVIAQDEHGDQSMEAWAVKESRMVVERIAGRSGDSGWTVSWKGRGWWQSFDEYLQFIRDANQIASGTGTLIVPSCKYHLPTPDENVWKTSEYDYTTRKILQAWCSSIKPKSDVEAVVEDEWIASDGLSMPLEKDFSPTLAGSDLAKVQDKILEWLRTIQPLVRAATPPDAPPIRLVLKVFNSLFDDAFQVEMLRTVHAPGEHTPRAIVYGNRLFDPRRDFDGHKGIAYGGPDLSDRNLRVMDAFLATNDEHLPWSATGNITTGRMALEYALRGASSFQLHTFFQLPADQYRRTQGTKTAKALHELNFHPQTGLVAWMLHLKQQLATGTSTFRLRDIWTNCLIPQAKSS
ncbi:MAG: hypothetical protein O3A00_24110 [Planctomycetota bacterium]|nr:hypothetical protein [Planctomycetota bacterium]